MVVFEHNLTIFISELIILSVCDDAAQVVSKLTLNNIRPAWIKKK